jgi:ABC-2 type transport system ATP-binding protein
VLDQGKLVAQGTTDQLKALIPGGHVRLQFADASGLESAARALGPAASRDDRLELQVPNDGTVRSLKVLLDRLAGESIEVERFSVHTPDLDDVFLAVTGRPRHEEVAIR